MGVSAEGHSPSHTGYPAGMVVGFQSFKAVHEKFHQYQDTKDAKRRRGNLRYNRTGLLSVWV
jgi:hypothetical protein